MSEQQTPDYLDPYLLEDPPGSVGRIFLARAFAHYCALHFGYSEEEITSAFRGDEELQTVNNVRMATRLLGEAFGRQAVRTWSRPIGGGEPVQLRSGIWELDRFDRRFATSAIDLLNPFDERARTTSWLFVDAEDFNSLLEASVAMHVSKPYRRSIPNEAPPSSPIGRSAPDSVGAEGGGGDLLDDRFVRLPELMRLTGLSRSTIYRRMAEGRFPEAVPMSGNIAAWRERDVARWLADPA